MSIESKHAYRFQFLKSDKWKAVRLEALVREKGKCQICGAESIYNDAHHIWYPKSVYETTEKHLVVLCRGCHEFIHQMIPDCKTRDESIGKSNWRKFKNAIVIWRMHNASLFQEGINLDVLATSSAGDLRVAYFKAQQEIKDLQYLKNQQNGFPEKPSIEAQRKSISATIKVWAKAYEQSVQSVITKVASPDI